MADEPNEILKEIALMEGIKIEDDGSHSEASDEQMEVSDGQEEERREEEQASPEEEREVLEEAEEPEESIEDRYARLLEAHNALAAQMMELRERGLPGVASPPTPAPVAPQPVAAPPPPIQAQPTPFSFNDQLLEKALVEDDPKALKEVLVGVVDYFSRELQSQRESMVRELPTITQNVSRQQLILMKAVDNFYATNPDLLPHQAVVGMVANDIVAKEPGLAMPDVLAKAEAEARKVLGLKKQVQKVEQASGRGKPAFAPVKSARKPTVPKIEGTRGEIARMQDAKW